MILCLLTHAPAAAGHAIMDTSRLVTTASDNSNLISATAACLEEHLALASVSTYISPMIMVTVPLQCYEAAKAEPVAALRHPHSSQIVTDTTQRCCSHRQAALTHHDDAVTDSCNDCAFQLSVRQLKFKELRHLAALHSHQRIVSLRFTECILDKLYAGTN